MSKRAAEEDKDAHYGVKKVRPEMHEVSPCLAVFRAEDASMGNNFQDSRSRRYSESSQASSASTSASLSLSSSSNCGCSVSEAGGSESAKPMAKGKGRSRRQTVAKAGSRPRRNRKRGRLEMLLNMPVEVFCEIASHLTPQDLLHMARSCRMMRDLFMSKRRSAAIWRAAREALDMPECPSDLSEPMYADLVFFKGCYFCGAARAQTLQFVFRLRLCRSCSDEHLVQLSQLHTISPIDTEFREFLRMVPHITFTLTGCFYYEKLVRDLWRDYLDWSNVLSVDRSFFENKVQIANKIMEHAERVNAWIRDRDDKLRIEREGKGILREKLIMERLQRECGYSFSELDAETGDTWKNHQLWCKLTRDPKPLTERIWRNLKPKLENVIDRRREYRRGSARPFEHLLSDVKA